MRKSDIVLISSILVIALIFLCLAFVFYNDTGDTVIVTVDGNEYARLPLDKDAELLIHGINNSTNLLIIKGGKAYISESTCENKICINTGYASELKTIVCSPNRVTVSIEKSN